MWFLKSGILLFKKSFGLNILIICQLAAVMLMITGLAIYYQNQTAQYRMTKELIEVNGGFFMMNFEKMESSLSEIEQFLNDDAEIYRVGYISTEIEGKTVLLQAVSRNFLNLLNFPLAKGKMNAGSNKDSIEAIASFGKVNSRYLVKSYWDDAFYVKLTGIMSSPYPYFDMGGTVDTLSMIFRWGKSEVNQPVVICALEDLQGMDSILYKCSSFVHIYNDAGDERAEEIKNYFKLNYQYRDVRELAASAEEYETAFHAIGALSIVIGIVAAVNFSLAVALTALRSLREIAVAYLCGAKNRDAYITTLCYGAVISLIAIVPTVLILNYAVPSNLILRGSLEWYYSAGLIGLTLIMFLGLTLLCSALALRQRKIAGILGAE